MTTNLWRMVMMVWVVLLMASVAVAQEAASDNQAAEPVLPPSWRLNGLNYEAQHWNNCGPATLTNALSYFGYSDTQTRAADWLKPNFEDKNVSPWQMVEFVNTQVPEIPVYALHFYGGDRTRLKQLISNNFPVIIEKGYDPEPDRLGWMGHYLLLTGYDDNAGAWITSDSYIGPEVNYDYEYIDRYWQHFNYAYIVLFTLERQDDLRAIMGDDMDPRQNRINALSIAQAEVSADTNDAFAWFNMGTNFVDLGMYAEAAQAYDRARNIGLPWRMMWYQFGPFEAYYEVGRYDDVITLARANLNDGGGQYVEETFYYGGRAREGLGDYQRALANYEAAISFNPNYHAAVQARQRLQQQLASGG